MPTTRRQKKGSAAVQMPAADTAAAAAKHGFASGEQNEHASKRVKHELETGGTHRHPGADSAERESSQSTKERLGDGAKHAGRADVANDDAHAAAATPKQVKHEPQADPTEGLVTATATAAEPAPVKHKSEHAGDGGPATAGGPVVEWHESHKSSFPPGQKPQVLERGHVFFFYRPKVMLASATSLEEVQRFYMLLKPTQGVSVAEGKPRLLVVAKKHLPATEGHKETMWCYVRKVSADESEVLKDLEAEDYDTATMGHRHVEPARPAGEGVYGFLMHHGHAHFAYYLTVPQIPGQVQHALNIRREASMIVQVKNPENPAPQRNVHSHNPAFAGLGEGHRPEYAQELMVGFENASSDKHKRYSSNEDVPRFLEVEGTEILLIGADSDVVGELHEPAEEIERDAAREARVVDTTNDPQAKLLHDLPSIAQLHAPLDAATSGTWA